MRLRIFSWCLYRAQWHNDAERFLRADFWFNVASLFDTGQRESQ